MKSVILAAGYATRMYPLTENFPKPLLPIGGSTILDLLLKDIDAIDDIDEHIIVVNHKFSHIFEEWIVKAAAQYSKPISILDDGSVDNEHRIGAVKDLILAIETYHIEDDILVAAADNLLDFSIKGFVSFFKERGAAAGRSVPVIMCYREERLAALQKAGVLCIDDACRVTLMEEKPAEPKGCHATPPFYIYPARLIETIRHAVENGCRYDAPGNLARYLSETDTLYAWVIPGHRYDVGDIETYNKYKAYGMKALRATGLAAQ